MINIAEVGIASMPTETKCSDFDHTGCMARWYPGTISNPPVAETTMPRTVAEVQQAGCSRTKDLLAVDRIRTCEGEPQWISSPSP